MYKFIKISQDQKAQWDTLVNLHPAATAMHMWEWTDFRNRVQPDSYKRVGVLKDNKLVLAGNYFINRFKLLGNVLYFPRGPIWTDEQALHFLVEGMKKVAQEENAFAIVLEPRILKNDPAVEKLQNLGFKVTDEAVQPRETLLLNIAKDEEELLLSFSKNTRYNIRYAEKKGITTEKYTSPEDVGRVDKFYQLLKETQSRKYFYVQPKRYFTELWQAFSKTGRAVLWEAKFEEKTLAMNITLNSDYWAATLFSASSREKSNLKATYLLKWDTILECKRRGCKIYDFYGATTSEDSTHPFYHTTQFKKGFGGEFIKFVGAMILPTSKIKYTLWQKALTLGIWKFYEKQFLREYRRKLT